MENDILGALELAEAQLNEDINFLICITEEYFTTSQTQESGQYLYEQFKAIINTVLKSMQYNQQEMRQNIDGFYKKMREKRS